MALSSLTTWPGWEVWLHPERLPVPAGEERMPDPAGLADFRLILALIAAEAVILTVQGKRNSYNLRQAVNNFVLQLLVVLAICTTSKLLHMVPYTWLHANMRVVKWVPQYHWAMHLCAFLSYDFTWYCAHRSMHESNMLWGAHNVHHSSPDYNLSTAMRASFIEWTIGPLFYLWMAPIIPPSIYHMHVGIALLYQTLTHTAIGGKLWWPIEAVFVTPSHHRVHHARNYGRKNHGGMLIIWDRMLGTFQAERDDRKPVYGLNSQPMPVGTYNPLWHNFHHYVATARLALSGKVPAWEALFTRTTGPGMIYPGTDKTVTAVGFMGKTRVVEVQAVQAGLGGKGAEQPFDPDYPFEKRALGPMDAYAVLHLAVAVPAILAFLQCVPSLSAPVILSGMVLCGWTITDLGWVMGATPKAIVWELLRLAAQGGLAANVLQASMTGSALPPQAALIVAKMSSMFYGASPDHLAVAGTALSAAFLLLVAAQLPAAARTAAAKAGVVTAKKAA